MKQAEFIALSFKVRPVLIASAEKHNAPDPESIVQKTLNYVTPKAYASIPATEDDARSFLLNALRMRIWHDYRRQVRKLGLTGEPLSLGELDEREHPTENPYPSLDIKTDVEKALAQLPDGVGVAVRLVYMEGCSVDEAAEKLGVPMRTLQKRIQRVLPRLREMLSEYQR